VFAKEIDRQFHRLDDGRVFRVGPEGVNTWGIDADEPHGARRGFPTQLLPRLTSRGGTCARDHKRQRGEEGVAQISLRRRLDTAANGPVDPDPREALLISQEDMTERMSSLLTLIEAYFIDRRRRFW